MKVHKFPRISTENDEQIKKGCFLKSAGSASSGLEMTWITPRYWEGESKFHLQLFYKDKADVNSITNKSIISYDYLNFCNNCFIRYGYLNLQKYCYG